MAFSNLEHAGFPPEGTVFPVSTLSLKVVDGEHPWVAEHRAEIDGNWAREIAGNPRLFNGQMVFQRTLSLDAGHVEGVAHMMPYAAFLYWRQKGRVSGGNHLFAMPIILSADQALIAIEMAATTANPGRVYCPAGVPDGADVVDGHLDMEANMRRETLEETGLDIAGMQADPGWYAMHFENNIAVMRVFRSAMTEAEIHARVMAHVATEDEPEISALLGIRSADPAAQRYQPFMPAILDWVFRDVVK
jgi:hypothetical protein